MGAWDWAVLHLRCQWNVREAAGNVGSGSSSRTLEAFIAAQSWVPALTAPLPSSVNLGRSRNFRTPFLTITGL